MEMEKKQSKGPIVTIVILAILVIALGGYIGYDKFLSKEEPTTNNNSSKNNTNTKNKLEENEDVEDSKKEIKTETNEVSSKQAKCYGTYYVNGNASDGIYTLKEDGTYNVENQEIFGVFTINENTITFIKQKHTTGPREEDPIYYDPESYLIYDDCSKIILTAPGSHTSASLEKAN